MNRHAVDTLSRLLTERFGETIAGLDALDLPDASALERILARRSCRSYAERPVAPALLDLLLACARSASSKSDLQHGSVLVVESADLRGQIGALLPGMPWIVEAPVFLLFLADMRRGRRICAQHGLPHANDSLDSFHNATVDAALMLQSFVLAAEAAGLGCCPISHVRNHLPAVCNLTGLPDGVSPVAGLCVGYPSQEALAQGKLSRRLPASLVVHRDRYDDSALPEALPVYDAARPAYPAGKQKNEAVYGTEPGLGWSRNAARQLSVPERFNFAQELRQRGFLLR